MLLYNKLWPLYERVHMFTSRMNPILSDFVTLVMHFADFFSPLFTPLPVAMHDGQARYCA